MKNILSIHNSMYVYIAARWIHVFILSPIEETIVHIFGILVSSIRTYIWFRLSHWSRLFPNILLPLEYVFIRLVRLYPFEDSFISILSTHCVFSTDSGYFPLKTDFQMHLIAVQMSFHWFSLFSAGKIMSHVFRSCPQVFPRCFCCCQPQVHGTPHSVTVMRGRLSSWICFEIQRQLSK